MPPRPASSRPRLPAAVRAAAGLRRRERVLAVAALDGGATAVATPEALVVVDGDGEPALRWARGWHEVDAGSWDDEGRVLQVTWVDGGRDALPVTGDPSTRLPEVLRERVQSSVVASRHVPVRGARGVRLVVRRSPQGLLLQEIPDRGVDLASPRTAAALAGPREELADQVGLTAVRAETPASPAVPAPGGAAGEPWR